MNYAVGVGSRDGAHHVLYLMLEAKPTKAVAKFKPKKPRKIKTKVISTRSPSIRKYISRAFGGFTNDVSDTYQAYKTRIVPNSKDGKYFDVDIPGKKKYVEKIEQVVVGNKSPVTKVTRTLANRKYGPYSALKDSLKGGRGGRMATVAALTLGGAGAATYGIKKAHDAWRRKYGTNTPTNTPKPQLPVPVYR